MAESASTAVLRVEVLSDGTAKVVGDLHRVAAASGALSRQTAAAGRTMQTIERAYSRTGRMVGGLVRSLTSLGGAFGFALGGAVIAKAAGSVRDFDQGLLNLRHSSGASADQIERVGVELTDMALRAGRPREELLAAARAAVNLGVGLDAVVKNLEAASNWARLLGVSVQEVAPAIAAVGKIAGEKVSIETQMAMTDVAVRRSGLSESDALKVIEKLAPRMAAAGLEGEDGLRTMVEVMSATGRFMSNPDEIISGWKGLQAAIARDKELREDLGVTSEDVMGAFHRLAGIAHHDARQLDGMGLPDEVRAFVLAAAQGMDEMARAGDELDGLNVEEFQGKLDDAARSTGADWDRLKEQLRQVLIPLGEGALKWLVEHKEELIGAFTALINGLLELASFAGWIVQGAKSSREQTVEEAVGEAGKGETPEERTFRLTQALGGKYGAEQERIVGEARTAGMSELEIARARRAAPLPTYYQGGEVDELGRVSAGEQVKIGEGTAIGRGVRAMQDELIRRLEVQNHITIRVTPETVHSDADGRQQGRRSPIRTTTEAELDRSLS